MSSCYKLSSKRDVWEVARQDCERNEAHLVIINGTIEEKVVSVFGDGVNMWIGVSGRKDTGSSSWTWTLVDGNPLTYGNWNKNQPQNWNNWSHNCGYADLRSSNSKSWFLGTCLEQYQWMCEKELHTSSA